MIIKSEALQAVFLSPQSMAHICEINSVGRADILEQSFESFGSLEYVTYLC